MSELSSGNQGVAAHLQGRGRLGIKVRGGSTPQRGGRLGFEVRMWEHTLECVGGWG